MMAITPKCVRILIGIRRSLTFGEFEGPVLPALYSLNQRRDTWTPQAIFMVTGLICTWGDPKCQPLLNVPKNSYLRQIKNVVESFDDS